MKNIRYAEKRAELPVGAQDDRLLDLYLPSGIAPSSGYPVVVWIHGGAFVSGSRGVGVMTNALRDRGFAVISVEYCLYIKHFLEAGGTIPREIKIAPGMDWTGLLDDAVAAASEDVELALKWIAGDGVGKYRLDAGRVVLGGGSAGAMTALNVACVRKNQTGSTIRCVVDFWGAVCDAAKLVPPLPPVYVVHGEADNIVSAEYGHVIKTRYDTLGIDCQSLFIHNAPHSPKDYMTQSVISNIADFVCAKTS